MARTKTAANQPDIRGATVALIARQKLGLITLETRNSDSLYFSDQAVWNLKAALEAAYDAGKALAEGAERMRRDPAAQGSIEPVEA